MSVLLKAIIGIRGVVADARFGRAAARPSTTQGRVLMQLVRTNADTDFGREHAFSSIRTEDDYRRLVPIREYEAFRPYVNRIIDRRKNILTAADPCMLTLTSGTTSEPKYIPVTKERLAQESALMLLWLYRSYRDHPGILDHACVSIVSQAVEGYTPSRIPFGSASGMIYRELPAVVRASYAITSNVSGIRDFETRFFVIARLALGHRVSYIATANPSSLIRLAETMRTKHDDIIRAIHDGALGVDLPDQREIMAQLSSRLKPDRARARHLADLAESNGELTPRECWPDLKMLGCWLGGSIGTQVRKLAPHYGDVPVRDLGYMASEGHFTVPIEDRTPSGVLAVGTNYYEFIPEDQLDAPQPTALSSHELEVGGRYGMVVSTASGLYRYDMNDIIEVTGHYRSAPLLAFVRKGRDMTNITGEKMHTNHILLALEKVSSKYNIAVVAQFRLVPNYEDSCYEIYLELEEVVAHELLRGEVIPALDRALSEVNVEYAQKRSSKRLNPPRLHVMRRGWAEADCRKAVASGRREAQYKWQILCPEPRPEDQSAIICTITSSGA